MQVLVCDGSWIQGPSFPECSGVLTSVIYEPNHGNPAMTAEQWNAFTYEVIGLFALVFGVLILKRVFK